MNIADKLTTIANNVERVFLSGEAHGEQRGITVGREVGYGLCYDLLWDAIQTKGTRTVYDSAFRGNEWTDESFKPKYDFTDMQSVQYMFYGCNITDLDGRLKRLGLTLDTRGVTQLYYFAANSTLTNAPQVGGKNVTNIQNAFNSCAGLTAIRELILSTTAKCSCTTAFRNCGALTEIRFNEGIRPTSLSFQWSPLLSIDSLASRNEDGKGFGLIPALSDEVSGSVTVSAAAVSAAFPDRAEWTALCNSKPTWTITEV